MFQCADPWLNLVHTLNSCAARFTLCLRSRGGSEGVNKALYCILQTLLREIQEFRVLNNGMVQTMKKICAALVCLILLLHSVAFAEEGMWLYNAVPEGKIKSAYGFNLTKEWLDYARLSSVKFRGASGSFVSPDGLLMTNHHVAAGCINTISTTAKDYMKTGFYAPTNAEEVRCPGLSVQVLQGIEDITARVKAAPKDGSVSDTMPQRSVLTTLQNECGTETQLNCQAVSMYSGAVYYMYKYKSYDDVRLVFAPEFSVAYFGGDRDNFEYPRYVLEVTFLRAYEDNKPLHTEHYFRWSKAGARKNELVFISGHPGSTQRLNTVAQLEFLRDVQYPVQIALQERTIAGLVKQESESDEARRTLERLLFNLQNSAKATKGYYSGLLDGGSLSIEARDENQLRDAYQKNEGLKAQYGDPWEDIADYYQAQREGNLYATRQYFPYFPGLAGAAGRGVRGGMGGPFGAVGGPGAFRGPLPDFALTLNRAVNEKDKPRAERSPAFRDSAVVEHQLFAVGQKIDLDEEIANLRATLSEMNRFLPGNPLVAKALNGKPPDQAARDIIAGTRVGDVDFRRRLYAGGKPALAGTNDPLVTLVQAAEDEGKRVNDEWTKKVTPLEAAKNAAETNLARIRFALQGLSYPPDANSTLRLTYGTIKGYVEDGSGTAPKGTKLAPFTTIGEAYDCSARNNNKDPYQLPESWLRAKGRVNRKIPLNFVSTNDIIGGNSGSPVLNRKAEVVGVVFDGNFQSLQGRFQYGDRANRAISVDSRAIIEALRKIYNAAPLADELTGRKSQLQLEVQ
jgi:hypothetical protein